jgi:uncharacterized protein (TIGR02757 family)
MGLKRTLKGVLDGVDMDARVAADPLRFPKRYADPHDIEVVAFVSAALAYGRVSLFAAVLERLFAALGPRPSAFIRGATPADLLQACRGLAYRFNKPGDLAALLHVLGAAMNEAGSLEALFMRGYRGEDEDVVPALGAFMDTLAGTDTRPVLGPGEKPYGLRQLLPRPAGGGACKRPLLFLRWMVRRGAPDMGLWRGIPPSKLIIPLDTHIARIARCLGLTVRRASDMRTAREITRALAALDPHDPIRYDFALSHLGISGACARDKCADCPIREGVCTPAIPRTPRP